VGAQNARGARLGIEPIRKRLPQSSDAPARSERRLEHRDFVPGTFELERSDEPRQPAPDDEHALRGRAADEAASHVIAGARQRRPQRQSRTGERDGLEESTT
jgi:hypothetical protein